MTDFEKVVHVLTDSGVEFVLVGGLAVVAHGYVRTTADLDLCYARSPSNLKRIVSALAPAKPRLRGAPPDLPFFFDEATLRKDLWPEGEPAGEVLLRGKPNLHVSAPSSDAAPILGREHQALQGRREPR